MAIRADEQEFKTLVVIVTHLPICTARYHCNPSFPMVTSK